MGKGILKSGLFSKKASSSGGGGGGTGDMLQAVYDPAGLGMQLTAAAIPLTQAEAVAKSDYIEGQLYCITDPPAPLKEFYAFAVLSPDSVYLFPTLDIHGFGYTTDDNYCLAVFAYNVSAGEEIKSIKIPAANIEVSTSSPDANATITEQLRLSGNNTRWYNSTTKNTSNLTAGTFNNCNIENCTINANSFTSCYIEAYEGLEDTIVFTANDQYISGLNKGKFRTISFNKPTNIYYKDCTIDNGKTININTSQTNKYWIGTTSNFFEPLDMADPEIYDSVTSNLKLDNYSYAGNFILYSSNPLLLAGGTIGNIDNYSTDVLKRTFVIDSYTVGVDFQAIGNIIISITIGAGSIALTNGTEEVQTRYIETGSYVSKIMVDHYSSL